MKTNHKNLIGGIMATAFWVALATGTSVRAQSDPGSSDMSIDKAYARLEALMTRTEDAMQYSVASVEDEEIKEALGRMEFLAQETERALRYNASQMTSADLSGFYDRLELLASITENEISCRVSDAVPVIIADNAVQKDKHENEHRNFLAFFNTEVKKSQIK
jgi:hypothetical protein